MDMVNVIPYERFGPRIEIKAGDQGAWLFAEGLVALAGAIATTARTAPKLQANVLMLTEIYRGGPGYHARHCAFDVRAYDPQRRPGAIVARSKDSAILEGHEWANRVRGRLPSYYDVVYGDERHIDHLHIELDLRKREQHGSCLYEPT